MPATKGGRRIDHVFAIVRLDEFVGPETPLERRITVKKVVRGLDAAEREVERLNKLQKEGVRYFWQHTRLENLHQTATADPTEPPAEGDR
jgi:hypothetical protein